MAEIAISKPGSGGGGSGLTGMLQQNATLTTGQTDIQITVNGGVLPLSDANIFLTSATGGIQQGAGAGEYGVNRATSPDQLELVTPVLGTLDFVILLFYP